MYEDETPADCIDQIVVRGGRKREILWKEPEAFRYVLTKGEETSAIEKNLKLTQDLKAPVKKGEIIGEIEYSMNGTPIGAVLIEAAETVPKMSFFYAYKKLWSRLALDT